MKNRNPQVKISLPPEVLRHLTLRAKKRQLTVTAFIRYLLMRYLDKLLFAEYIEKYEGKLIKK